MLGREVGHDISVIWVITDTFEVFEDTKRRWPKHLADCVIVEPGGARPYAARWTEDTDAVIVANVMPCPENCVCGLCVLDREFDRRPECSQPMQECGGSL